MYYFRDHPFVFLLFVAIYFLFRPFSDIIEKCSTSASRQQLPIICEITAKSADLLNSCTRQRTQASDVHQPRFILSFFWHALLSQKYSLPNPAVKARLPPYSLPQQVQGGRSHALQYGDTSQGRPLP